MPLLLMHATAAHVVAAAACPDVLAAACPAVLAAALLASSKQQQHWELAKTVLLTTWIFAPRQRNLPLAGEKDERQFEKRHLCSSVPRLPFHVQAVLVSCQEQRIAWRDTG